MKIITNRRSFIEVGGLTLGGLGLPSLTLGQESKAEKNVIMLFLGGGMSHAESFTAAPDSIDRYRSVTGYIKTKSDFHLGGHWEKLAERSRDYTVVHSFLHNNAGHQGGTHYVMTGYNSTDENPGAPQNHPSYGSVVTRQYGSNNKLSGMPHYVAVNQIYGQSASFLGSMYGPLSLDGDGKRNLGLNIPADRFSERRNILASIDNLSLKNETDYRSQAYQIMLGKVKEAFATENESQAVKTMYGDKTVGKQLMLARRLVQNGVKFVSVMHGGWDMHAEIKTGMEKLVPEVDHALAMLFDDLKANGLFDNTLVVVATEFGRTPMNAQAGRDHWAVNTPLLLAGGNYQGGKVVGEVDKNGFNVVSNPLGPIDLLKTIMHHMDIQNQTFIDHSGRPRFVIEGEAKLI